MQHRRGLAASPYRSCILKMSSAEKLSALVRTVEVWPSSADVNTAWSAVRIRRSMFWWSRRNSIAVADLSKTALPQDYSSRSYFASVGVRHWPVMNERELPVMNDRKLPAILLLSA